MRRILNALRITTSLRNTININGILHGIRCLPCFGKYISERIYGIRVFKILAMIVSVHVEIFKAFAGKLCLFLFLFFASGAISSYNELSQKTLFIYGFLVLSLGTSFTFSVFEASQESEYGVLMLGMDAKEFVLGRLIYKCASIVVGNIVFGIPAALLAGVNWYLALLLPVVGVAFRVTPLGLEMLIYSAKLSMGRRLSRKGLPVSIIGSMDLNVGIISLILVIGGAVTPFVVKRDPFLIIALIYVAVALTTIPGIFLIRRFPYGLYRTAISDEQTRKYIIKKKEYKQTHGYQRAEINSNAEVKTRSKGFKYLNDIFEKRHGKVLWGRLIGAVIGTAASISLASIFLYFELKHGTGSESVLRFVFSYHSGLFTVILLMINSGASISHAMFSSCDSAMLVYGFYRTPAALRNMFRLRMGTVIKYNLAPALMMGVYSIVVTAITGGEAYPMQYISTLLLVLVNLVFFSARHMAIYYLIQPYSSDFMIKSKLYVALSSVIFVVCFILIFIHVPVWILAGVWSIITIGYIVIAGILIYRFGPRTFRVK